MESAKYTFNKVIQAIQELNFGNRYIQKRMSSNRAASTTSEAVQCTGAPERGSPALLHFIVKHFR